MTTGGATAARMLRHHVLAAPPADVTAAAPQRCLDNVANTSAAGQSDCEAAAATITA
jgi:hypothetical protein